MTSRGVLESAGTGKGYGSPRQISRRGLPDWDERLNERSRTPATSGGWSSPHGTPSSIDEGVFQHDNESRPSSRPTSKLYALGSPGLSSSTGDLIVWSRWDVIGEGLTEKRILILGYVSGLQIWDCTHLGSVSEIMNLSGTDWQGAMHAAILPLGESSDEPRLGIILPNTFIVYSLHRHHITQNIQFPGVLSFSSSHDFIVISTVNPPALHVLSSYLLQTLHIIPSASLVPFVHSHHNSLNNNNNNNNILPPSDTSDNPNYPYDLPRPVHTLSGRLLAYASIPPSPESSVHGSAHQPRTATSTQIPRTRSPTVAAGSPGKTVIGQGSPSGGFGMTNAEIGNVALKVGGSVLSGMKTLGGMAFSAAKSAATGEPASPTASTTGKAASNVGGLTSMFFSRSAPAAVERRTTYDMDRQRVSVLPDRPGVTPSSEGGYCVAIMDLGPLLQPAMGPPRMVTQFFAPKHSPVSELQFNGDGTSLIVSPRDGQVLQVYKIRSMPATQRTSQADTARKARSHTVSVGQEAPFHLYDLRRGRTSAVVEGVDVARDGRWIAIGTRKRTVHVFPVNPYGGKPDSNSHLEGTVRNVLQLQPLSIDVSPLVRLRMQKTPTMEQPKVPLSFTFIDSSGSCLPTNLLPAPSTSHPTSAGLPGSYTDSLHSEALSSHPSVQSSGGSNYQDILLFDPLDGTLSLRRFVVEVRAREGSLSIPGSSSYGMISSSLPGMSTSAGRFGSSPTVKPHIPHAAETPTELVARDMILATWNLRRREDWGQIKRSLEVKAELPELQSSKADWLAQAELSTCSRSHGLLPRPIYLSHQFSFHALGEDYHALIRRHQLDVGGTKIEVRKEVEVSAYSADMENSFLEGFSSRPREMRKISSSFDEPLASALSGGLEYPRSTPSVLPMLPNGGRPASFRNSMPIRAVAAGLTDGVSGVSGRIRREIGKTRSPPTMARADSLQTPVPLEFDEEDEDFAVGLKVEDAEENGSSHSREESRLARSALTLETSVSLYGPDIEVVEEDPWGGGWTTEDKEAIQEAERFDDISAAGIMDEERALQAAAAAVGPAPLKKKGRGKKK